MLRESHRGWAEDGGQQANCHGPGVSDEIHPRLLAVIVAARFYGMELDPGDFPRMPGEHMPSAAALAVWLRNVGMWARAVRLRWRQLMRLQDTGPVVLLFSAGLLIGVNPEHNVVVLKNPRTANLPPPVCLTRAMPLSAHRRSAGRSGFAPREGQGER
jgi:hypothetical protein